MTREPWVRKYTPRTPDAFIGNPRVVGIVRERLSGFSRGARPLLLHGPTGVGKTSLVYVVAASLGMDVLEINASDTRNKAAMESLVGAASQQQSLFFRGRVILVDEVDGISGVKDRGAVTTLLRLAEQSAHPIVFTANEAQSDKLKALRKKAELLQIGPPPAEEISRRLRTIADAEGLAITGTQLRTIAIRSGGDVRAAINDLQVLSTGEQVTKEEIDLLSEREQETAIEQALLRVFKTTSSEVALPSFDNVHEQPDRILLWIQEALPREYTKPEDLARAFQAVAEADRFFGRIRRWQYYRFYVYIYNLLSVGVACAKDEKYAGTPVFKRPERPLKIWIYNQKNLKRKRIAEQLAPWLHASTKRVTQDVLPFLKCVDEQTKAAIVSSYKLDADAASWL